MFYVLQRSDNSQYRGGDGLWHADIAKAMRWVDQSEASQCAVALSKEVGCPVEIKSN